MLLRQEGFAAVVLAGARSCHRTLVGELHRLSGLVGSSVSVTPEIEARIPKATPEDVVRIGTENARTLKFGAQGFEQE